MRVCSVHGCPELYPPSEGTRCKTHRAQADKARGTPRDRGYSGGGHQAFRTAVITRDPICMVCTIRVSTVADHYPLSRRELIDMNLNANDPAHGRGLCAPCHSRETAQHQPGGWHDGT